MLEGRPGGRYKMMGPLLDGLGGLRILRFVSSGEVRDFSKWPYLSDTEPLDLTLTLTLTSSCCGVMIGKVE